MGRLRNKFEKDTAHDLQSHGIDFEYETRKLAYSVTGNYIPDFIITTRSGNTLYVETKGNGRSFDGVSRRKLIAVKDQHREIDLRIVFYSDGKIGPKRKDGTFLRQSDWAIKHGFKFAIRRIPEEWLND